MRTKLYLGVPCYGTQEPEWWASLAAHTAVLGQQFDLTVAVASTMATDHNRNDITDKFLKSDAEWLFWIDADTVVPIGAVTRLMSLGKTLASGLYYGKNPPHNPIAYVKYNKAYIAIEKTQTWERGEILPVDASGMGCLLTHRSVYEDIQKNFTVLQRVGGGLLPVHKNDIEGAFSDTHEHDGKVYKGQLRTRMTEPTIENYKYPYFGLEFGRTEDIWFFELAARVGHKVWLDTSLECGHLRAKAFTGEDYRDLKGR
jgi:hypothetical protein